MRRLSNLTSIVRRSLLTRWLHLRVSLLLAFGRTTAAEAVLRRIVHLRPASFRAHFLLGRVAFDDDRQGEAIQELAICHRLDPDRFLRQSLPAVLVDEVTTRSLAFPDSPLFDVPPAEAGPLPQEWDDLLAPESPFDLSVLDGSYDVHAAPPGTDFGSAEEFLRFRDLPPISSEQVVDVDLDALMTRLVEDPHPGEARDQA